MKSGDVGRTTDPRHFRSGAAKRLVRAGFALLADDQHSGELDGDRRRVPRGRVAAAAQHHCRRWLRGLDCRHGAAGGREASIPSFYFASTPEADRVARRDWTRSSWTLAGTTTTELVTSVAVTDELERGAFPARDDSLALVGDVPLVASDQAGPRNCRGYVRHRLMPPDPTGDALHLALPSYHGCDFLVTWHCKHLGDKDDEE